MGPCSWYQLRSAVLSRAGLSVCGGKIRSLTGMNGLTRDVQSPEADLVSYTLAYFVVVVERKDRLSRLINKQHLQNHPRILHTRCKANDG